MSIVIGILVAIAIGCMVYSAFSEPKPTFEAPKEKIWITVNQRAVFK